MILVKLAMKRRGHMEQTFFMVCMFFGVVSVGLIALILLGIALGKISV